MEAIDFVVTWVDGNDPEWRRQKNEYMGVVGDNSDVRFRDWDILRYWFRSVEKFTPWVRKIHFVTWGHLPEWLDTTNPKLNIVKHEDFIPERYLPTFNSHTIELNLHRIEGLAENFVYFNDDIFIIKDTPAKLFFNKGYPCATFGLQVINFKKNGISWILGSNIAVINTHFKMRKVIRSQWRKTLSPKNGLKKVGKTMLLYLCAKSFPGLFNGHNAIPFSKSTFDEVWSVEEEVLDETCSCHFRGKTNVNPYLMEYWQMVSGKFTPRKSKYARTYHVNDKNINRVLRQIERQECNLLCINDTEYLTDWEGAARRASECFEKILPEKCSFEK